VCSADVEVEALPTLDDTIGHEVLIEHLESFGLVMSDGVLSSKSDGAEVALDLRHANDLITPVAALLALASGGSVSGAEHAAYKETDRTVGTVALLEQFGLNATYQDGVLNVPGGQTPQTPSGMVETYGDHRMQMTALVLAMGCKESVLIKGATLHEVADPGALQRWRAVGVTVETVLHEPWK
jgi:5-enolpyruvylshikimate-3-phosphate synthase